VGGSSEDTDIRETKDSHVRWNRRVVDVCAGEANNNLLKRSSLPLVSKAFFLARIETNAVQTKRLKVFCGFPHIISTPFTFRLSFNYFFKIATHQNHFLRHFSALL
jgi:hypothetical protein